MKKILQKISSGFVALIIILMGFKIFIKMDRDISKIELRNNDNTFWILMFLHLLFLGFLIMLKYGA